MSKNTLPTTKKTTMVNFVSTTNKNNVTICLKNSQEYYLPFDKKPMDISDTRTRDRFIKYIEKLIRHSRHYKQYERWLKMDCKLNRCAVFGNIKQENLKQKTKIEMHHGPIFTLYDIVSIVLTKNLSENLSGVNTFSIAKEVLDLHRRKMVQTVMLSQSVHKSMDNPKIAPFLTLDMTFGNIYAFLQEYGRYLSPKNISDLKNYFLHYQANIDTNKLNVFTPEVMKYNIRYVGVKSFATNNPLLEGDH